VSVPTITVSELRPGAWRVEVAARTPTAHEVSIDDAWLRRLGLGDIPPARVLEESFRFLLEREPNTSILGSFELPLVGRYFPEFERTIVARLRS
jgi:hypothetical protein